MKTIFCKKNKNNILFNCKINKLIKFVFLFTIKMVICDCEDLVNVWYYIAFDIVIIIIIFYS